MPFLIAYNGEVVGRQRSASVRQRPIGSLQHGAVIENEVDPFVPLILRCCANVDRVLSGFRDLECKLLLRDLVGYREQAVSQFNLSLGRNIGRILFVRW